MNVVFIVLDSLRKDKLSVYNADIDFTENLERLSDKGTIFEDVVTHSNWALPSYSSMLTGLYPWDHGATQKRPWLDIDDVEEYDRDLIQNKAPEEIEKIAITSNPWVTDATGLTKGFDTVENFTGVDAATGRFSSMWPWLFNHEKWFNLASFFKNNSSPARAEKLVERAEEVISEAEDDFFLFMNFMDAHLPYKPPEEYMLKHLEDPEGKAPKDEFHVSKEEINPEITHNLYNAEVDYLDDQIGNLIDMFQNRDMMEETVFIVTADHGERLGEKGIGHYFSVDEEVISIPFIVAAPNLEGERTHELFELKSVYKLIFSAFEEDDLSIPTSDYVLGGSEEPDLLNMQGLAHDKEKLRFVRDSKKKLVREGTTEFGDTMLDIITDVEIDIEEEFRDRMGRIEEIEEDELLEEKKKQVKSKLEDLGYI